MLLHDALAYSEKEKVLGTVVEYSRVKGTATLKHKEELHVVDANEIVVMKKVGNVYETDIYEGDIFRVIGSDVRYMIKLSEVNEGEAFLQEVDKKLNGIEDARRIRFPVSDLYKKASALELLENYYILREQLPHIDFNVNVVREHKDGETKYFYIGNNNDEETVDVTKVIFLGSTVLGNEKYERTTISIEDYLKRVEMGIWVEVRPHELSNYLLGMTGESEVQPKEKSKPFIKPSEKPASKKHAKSCGHCGTPKCTCDLFE